MITPLGISGISPNGAGLNDQYVLANRHLLGDIHPLGYYIHWVNHTHWDKYL